VNKETYIGIFRRLKDKLRRKRAEKWTANSWFLFHDNVSAHPSVLVKDLLGKNKITLEHPPYSPDQAISDFYLFPSLKSALKGRSFCDLLTYY